MTQKLKAAPKKRTRKPKVAIVPPEETQEIAPVETPVEPVEAPVEAPAVSEQVYNHVRWQRCNRRLNTNAHPAFLHNHMVCGGLMESVKTSDGGKYKHYKCPVCGEIAKVEGVLL